MTSICRTMHYSNLRFFQPTLIKQWRCGVSVGIDLGTCNSAIAAVVKSGQVKNLPVFANEYQISSSVISTKTGLVPRAEIISSDQSIDDACLISNSKRLIGRAFDSIADASRFPFHLKQGSDNSTLIQTPLQTTTPEEVSGVILKYLIESAQRESGEKVDHAVITIPVHFSVSQKSATLVAAGLAGIESVSLLQEPIAAALAHGLGKPVDHELILVLDVGGGTYDVSILSSFDGIMEVIAFAGDHSLGGLDFDYSIAQWIMQKTQTKKLSPSVMKLAERVKREVIECGSSRFQLHDVEVTLKRDEFDFLTKPLTSRFLNPILEAGKTALIDWCSLNDQRGTDDPYQPPPKRITQVVFAGGSSSLPSLHSLVHNLTHLPPQKSKIDPKLCVSYGAAVYAGMLEGSINGIEIMDGAYSKKLHNRVTGMM